MGVKCGFFDALMALMATLGCGIHFYDSVFPMRKLAGVVGGTSEPKDKVDDIFVCNNKKKGVLFWAKVLGGFTVKDCDSFRDEAKSYSWI